LREIKERFPTADVPLPPHWGGYRLRPEEVEFWQGREDRLHDRIRYVRDGERWRVERLSP
jgi:pyridoxamine 5'-phosphate oxidase